MSFDWGNLVEPWKWPGLFGDMMHSPNPANSAMPYYNQIPGMLQNAYNPWIQGGMQDYGMYQGQLGQLINDPAGKMNSFGKTFQQSPGYQFQVDQSLGAANRAAAAGGMAGSPAEQQSIAGTVNNLANQDYYNYLNHVTGMYGQGMSGLNDMSRMGFQASNSLADSLAASMMNQGNLAYSGQMNQNQSNQGMWGGLFGMLGQGAIAAMMG